MSTMLRAALIALCLAVLAPAQALADSLELLFVDRAGCPYCARFEREALDAYQADDLGRDAPIRRVSLDDGQPKGPTLQEPVRFTPTFVLLIDGREVGRVVGYSDNAMFFGLVEKLISDARRKPDAKS
jgi:hypothetical protein